MIQEHCFGDEWIEKFRRQKDHKKIDKIILQKMIFALYLLEQLKVNGLDFIFKGGTSLVLLLETDNRFSIDIDIICKTEKYKLEAILQRIIETTDFEGYELDEHRSYQPGVPKSHYKFSFKTSQQGSGTILLDVLIEDSIYPELIEVPIQTKWIETNEETMVTVPSIDSITGDKLTAFAPNTIGIPYFKGKDNQPFSMEICKQLFDLSRLFEQIKDVTVVAASFMAFAKQEIAYRKNGEIKTELSPDKVLEDTINTCLVIATRGRRSHKDKRNFDELQKGIRAFGSGFLMQGNFRIDDAIPASARIAYLSAKLLKNDFSPLQYFDGQDVKPLNIEDPGWNFMNRLKRQPDKSSFYYWYNTVKILKSN